MDIVTLRKCTMKSKLGFGKYPNETIERIIADQAYRYIREVYYTVEYIDFTDDVKQAVNIIFNIDKPGVNRELMAKNNEVMDAKCLNKYGYRGAAHIRAQRRKSEKEKYISRAFGNHLSKGQLQAINHGKMNQE